MEEHIRIIHKKLKILEDELATMEDIGSNKLTYKVKTNKKIKNIEKEVDKLKAAFDKLCCEKEVEKALVQNLRNDKIEACVPQNLPKVFDPKKTVTVRKGEKWRYHNLNAWLENQLKLKGQWTIKNLGHKVMHKQVQFFKIEYKNFILSRKSVWDKEDIWIWEDMLAVKSADPKLKLIDYGNHQKKHGKHVTLCDDCLFIDGQKYVWDSKMNRVVTCKEGRDEHKNIFKTDL